MRYVSDKLRVSYIHNQYDRLFSSCKSIVPCLHNKFIQAFFWFWNRFFKVQSTKCTPYRTNLGRLSSRTRLYSSVVEHPTFHMTWNHALSCRKISCPPPVATSAMLSCFWIQRRLILGALQILNANGSNSEHLRSVHLDDVTFSAAAKEDAMVFSTVADKWKNNNSVHASFNFELVITSAKSSFCISRPPPPHYTFHSDWQGWALSSDGILKIVVGRNYNWRGAGPPHLWEILQRQAQVCLQWKWQEFAVEEEDWGPSGNCSR